MAILLLLVSRTTAYCTAVSCSTGLTDGVCYNPSGYSQEVSVQQCSEGLVCSANQMYSTLPLNIYDGAQNCVDQDYSPFGFVDGESCFSGSDCASSVCTNSVCVGKTEGDKCLGPEDCAIGLTCWSTSSVCAPPSAVGSLCYATNDCSNDSDCFIDICAPYFSVSDGTYIGNSTNLLCISGFSENSVCAVAPANVLSAGSQCFSSYDCALTTTSMTTECACGLNTEGRAYCTTAPGDQEFLAFKSAYLDLLNINQNCQAAISNSERCPQLKNTPQLVAFLNAYYISLYRYLIIDTPSCVVSTIAPFAANYVVNSTLTSSNSSSTVTIIILSVVIPVIFIVGVVCYVCVRRAQTRNEPNIGGSPMRALRIEIIELETIHVEAGAAERDVFTADDLPRMLKKNPKGIPLSFPVDPQSRVPDETWSEYADGYKEAGDSLSDETLPQVLNRVKRAS